MKKGNVQIERLYPSAPQGLRLLLLCGFFVIGAALGHIIAQINGNDTQLYESLVSFASRNPSTQVPSFGKVIAAYLRFPLLALLLGYCSFALFAIPALVLVQGLTLSLAASTLVVTLGISGLPLALATFGLRSFVTVASTLILSLLSFERALGRIGERKHPIQIMSVCLFLLLLGITLELTVVPSLFSSALASLES